MNTQSNNTNTIARHVETALRAAMQDATIRDALCDMAPYHNTVANISTMERIGLGEIARRHHAAVEKYRAAQGAVAASVAAGNVDAEWAAMGLEFPSDNSLCEAVSKASSDADHAFAPMREIIEAIRYQWDMYL